ncbi:MAG: hypothetical protein RMK29_06915 [Myxococcales bacterium]|nr:hypothetical protein [Myxococcota bacterium]MDW8281424.1 hypothetical protein [Myxococcales bacterium]
MGKLIPPRVQAVEEPADPVPRMPQPGPQQLQARELLERLRRLEESLDLDELDRLARRHARPPASGAPEALEALAVIVREVPELFHRAEVNLDPNRLEQIADRQRALGLLCTAVARFYELVQDSHIEQGDEVVELLTVGWERLQRLPPERLLGSHQLVAAMRVLQGYQERVVAEGAHLSPAQQQPRKKPGNRR